MNCPGLHCSGCGRGGLGVVAVLLVAGFVLDQTGNLSVLAHDLLTAALCVLGAATAAVVIALGVVMLIKRLTMPAELRTYDRTQPRQSITARVVSASSPAAVGAATRPAIGPATRPKPAAIEARSPEARSPEARTPRKNPREY